MNSLFFKFFAGALGGFIAVAVLPPKTILEAVFRAVTAISSAVLFTGTAMDYFKFAQLDELGRVDTDNILFVGGVISFSAWFALGILAKIMNKVRESDTPIQAVKDTLREIKEDIQPTDTTNNEQPTAKN